MSTDSAGNGLNDAREMFLRFGPPTGIALVVLVLLFAGLSRVGCVNLHVPPGHEGYVRSRPIADQAEHIGTLIGPTSTGWVWRQEVVNIDMRQRNYSEEMTIVTGDKLDIEFRAHAWIRLRRGSVKELVERFNGPDWYTKLVQKTFTGSIQKQVRQLKSFEVKARIDDISRAVMLEMTEQFKGTPIEFLAVNIGDIQYPEVVVESIVQKFVTEQDIQRKKNERNIAQKKIAIAEVAANGKRDAQRIIGATLDPMYLQLEALDAIAELAKAPNTTFVVAPSSRDGVAPLIMSLGSEDNHAKK